MQQFATSFAPADRVLVPDIYFVRDSEAERQAVTAQDLVDALNEQGTDAAHFASFDAIVAHLRAELRPGDLIVTMGAGNVGQIAHTLVATQTE
jgi:UDP-N-acetylmuramate--alanine ligase